MATLKLAKPSDRFVQPSKPEEKVWRHPGYSHIPAPRHSHQPVLPDRTGDSFELVDIELKNWGWWMANLQGVSVGYGSGSVGFENAGVSYVDHEDDLHLRESVGEQSRPDDERAVRCDQLIQRVCSERDKACLLQRFVEQASAREASLTISRKRDKVTGVPVWKCTHTRYLEWLNQAKAKLDTAYKLSADR